MSWYKYFVVAATSVAVLLSTGTRHFSMAWRSSGSSNAQLIDNLQGIFRHFKRAWLITSPDFSGMSGSSPLSDCSCSLLHKLRL